MLLRREQLVDRDDHGRVVADPQLAVDHLGQLGERPHAVLRLRLRDVLRGALALLGRCQRGELLHDLVDADARIPDVERVHRGVLANRLAVGAGHHRVDGLTLLRAEAAIASRDGEARDEPLHIPLERPRQRLVEVVDVEHERAIRRGIGAEVREVRVAAELRLQARARNAGEVRGHEVRGPAIERERGDEHPPVAHRHEFRHARGRLLLEQVDRLAAVRRWCPLGMGAARDLAPGGPPELHPLLDGEVLDDRLCLLRHRAQLLRPRASGRRPCRRRSAPAGSRRD